MTTALDKQSAPGPVPDGFDRWEVEQFLYREARLADESDYDAWEALWTDDALYWVPVAGTDDPARTMSVIYDNRSRIATRLKQVRTGKRYAQAPPSNLRRLVSNIEFLGGRTNSSGGVDLEVAANFLVLGPAPAAPSCGADGPLIGCAARTASCGWRIRRSCW